MKYVAFLALFLFSCLPPQKPVTLFLAGDSTMAKKLPEKRPETGWGEFLQQLFDSSAITVENHARNGRSTRTFLSEERWQAIVDKLKEGDYVFIQFGHNDESEQKVDRYTPPSQYRTNLILFITTARAKNATPVLLTPVMRRRFNKQGEFYDTHGEYPDIVRSVAAEYKVPMIDMHMKMRKLIESYGEEGSNRLFLRVKPGENSNYPEGVEDNTHFSPLGAKLVAELAAEGIRESGIELSQYLKKTSP